MVSHSLPEHWMVFAATVKLARKDTGSLLCPLCYLRYKPAESPCPSKGTREPERLLCAAAPGMEQLTHFLFSGCN